MVLAVLSPLLCSGERLKNVADLCHIETDAPVLDFYSYNDLILFLEDSGDHLDVTLLLVLDCIHKEIQQNLLQPPFVEHTQAYVLLAGVLDFQFIVECQVHHVYDFTNGVRNFAF